MRGFAYAMVLCLGLGGVPAGAAAQDAQGSADAQGQESRPSRRDRARAAFRAGEQAYYAGRFSEALDRFTLAYELSARAELLYNIGTAHDRLGRNTAALQAYRDYLEARPQAQNRDFVLARIAVLEAPAEAQGAEAAGQRAGDATVDAGTTEAVSDGSDDAEVESDGAPADGAERLGTTVPAENSGGPNVAGIALLGTAGAAGIAAVVTGVMALGQRSDLDEQCPEGRCTSAFQSDLDRLDRLTISTDVLIGVAAVAATVGVVLLVTSGGDDDDESFTAGCGLGVCEARLRW